MSVKLKLFSYQSIKTCVLGAQKNRLIETVLLSTHNICFGWEIKKINFQSHAYLEARYISRIRILPPKHYLKFAEVFQIIHEDSGHMFDLINKTGFAQAWKVLEFKSPWKLNLPWKVLENHSKALKSPWILLFYVGLSTVDRDLNK